MRTREQQIKDITWLGMALNALLTAFKLVAGAVGKSSAMIADGIHSLSDFLSDIIILVFLKISRKGRDKDHEYGHGKFETMATFILSVILLVVAVQIFVHGTEKVVAILKGEEVESPSMIALIAAIVSILIKEFCYQITARVGKKVKSPALIANAWHHRSDALSSIGSLAGIGCAMFLGNKWVILDPIVGCIIGAVIFGVGIKIAVPALKELLDISLPDEVEEEILSVVKSVDGVVGAHNLKTRHSGEAIIIDAHILVDHNISITAAHDIATSVENALKSHFGDETQTSLHVEPDNYSHLNHD